MSQAIFTIDPPRRDYECNTVKIRTAPAMRLHLKIRGLKVSTIDTRHTDFLQSATKAQPKQPLGLHICSEIKGGTRRYYRHLVKSGVQPSGHIPVY
jgi:hypothetical protein